MVVRFLSAFVMLALSAGFAQVHSQSLSELVGMVSTKGSRITSGGKLSGCSIEFKALFRDDIYREGQYGSLVGSFSVLSDEQGGASFLLKGLVHDLVLGANGIEFRPNPPETIQLETSSGQSTAKIASVDMLGESPGSRLKGFGLSDETAVFLSEFLYEDQTAFLFNRRKGGMDVRVVLDFTVIDTDAQGGKVISRDEITTFRLCVGEFLKELASN